MRKSHIRITCSVMSNFLFVEFFSELIWSLYKVWWIWTWEIPYLLPFLHIFDVWDRIQRRGMHARGQASHIAEGFFFWFNRSILHCQRNKLFVSAQWLVCSALASAAARSGKLLLYMWCTPPSPCPVTTLFSVLSLLFLFLDCELLGGGTCTVFCGKVLCA